ncbi:dixin-like [Lampetra planeri]
MIASLSRGSLLDEVLHGGFNEQQLAAYVSWVNSQLKRTPGLKPITDLRYDLQDGVVLIQLIEIVSGEVLSGVYATPQNKEESRRNVEQVLQFISSRHIRMPHISARDIVEGNLKSVMRVILALAAHFKPSANHRIASGSVRSLKRGSSSHTSLSTVALVQGAAAALVSARLDAAQPASATRIHGGLGLDREKSVCVRALVEQYERGTPDEQENTLPDRWINQYFVLLKHQHVESSHGLVESAWEDSVGETLEKEVQETRKMVSALQALLLDGSLPEDEQDVSLTLEQGNPEQRLVVIRSRLDQSMEEARDLRRELLRCKQEMRNLQAVKDAQQQRISTQEASILHLKQELIRAGITKDEVNNRNTELQWKLEECNRLWGDCKKEIGQKDRVVQQLKQKLEESQRQQSELGTELEHKNNLLQELMNRDLQQVVVFHYAVIILLRVCVCLQAEEVQLLQDALRSLRNNFRDHDPQHHTLDTLEQGIVSLIDRLHVLHTHRVCQSNNISASSTKILYFTGKSSTPSMINIPKRLGEVTLKDVKAAVDREGDYRYHFKALDPEFGTVKEELFLDGAIVPGWEGKIVAWVEEDRGEER